jgi:hypothetical protein
LRRNSLRPKLRKVPRRSLSMAMSFDRRRLLGVHHPFGFAQWCQVLGERVVVGEPSMIAEELQATGVACRIGRVSIFAQTAHPSRQRLGG